MTFFAAVLLLTLPPVPTLMWPFQPQAVVGDYEVKLGPAKDGGQPMALELELRERGQADGSNLLETPSGTRPLPYSVRKKKFALRHLSIRGSRQLLRVEFLGAMKTKGPTSRRSFRRFDLLVSLEDPPN